MLLYIFAIDVKQFYTYGMQCVGKVDSLLPTSPRLGILTMCFYIIFSTYIPFAAMAYMYYIYHIP